MNQTVVDAIESDIQAIERNSALGKEINFARRAEAIDRLEFIVIDRIEGLSQRGQLSDRLLELRKSAVSIKRQLEAVNDALFRRLRAEVRAGGYTGQPFRRLLGEFVGCGAGRGKGAGTGYDTLDLFVNGLLLHRDLPANTAETSAREAEMIGYQQTPVRVVLELADRAALTAGDVFYDVGSGLGHVPILVHLLTGARTRGIEREPAYWAYARASAEELHLPDVEFVNVDARAAVYRDGTVFFLYTPFVGALLQEVLEKLREVSVRRAVRIFTYGPCTERVSHQPWLRGLNPDGDVSDQLCEFQSK